MRDNLTTTLQHLTDLGDRGFTTEAARIGLKPNEWPDQIHVIDDGGTALTFRRGAARRPGARPTGGRKAGELAGYAYATRGGLRLFVAAPAPPRPAARPGTPCHSPGCERAARRGWTTCNRHYSAGRAVPRN